MKAGIRDKLKRGLLQVTCKTTHVRNRDGDDDLKDLIVAARQEVYSKAVEAGGNALAEESSVLWYWYLPQALIVILLFQLDLQHKRKGINVFNHGKGASKKSCTDLQKGM